MGMVSLKLDADQAKLVQGVLKADDSVKRLITSTNRLGQAGRQADGGLSKLGRTSAQEITRMVAGWASVGAGVAMFHKAIGLAIEDMKRLADQNRQTTLSLTQRIAGAGDLTSAGRIRQFVAGGGLVSAGVGGKEGAELYGAVRGVLPTADLDRVLAITQFAAKGKKAAYFGGTGAEFAETAAEVAKAMPEISAEDAGDIAAYVAAAQGKYGRKIAKGGWKAVQQWRAAGLGDARAGMGLMLAGATAGQGAEPFQALVQRVTEQRDMPALAFGKKLTPQEEATRRWYGATPKERMAMVRAGGAEIDYLFTTQAPAIHAMMKARPAQFERQMALAAERDILRLSGQRAMMDPAWHREMKVQEAEAEAEAAEYQAGAGADVDSIRLRQAHMRAGGKTAGWRAIVGAVETVAAAGGQGAIAPEFAGRSVPEDIDRQLDLSGPAADLKGAAADLRQAADKLANQVPSVNAHTE